MGRPWLQRRLGVDAGRFRRRAKGQTVIAGSAAARPIVAERGALGSGRAISPWRGSHDCRLLVRARRCAAALRSPRARQEQAQPALAAHRRASAGGARRARLRRPSQRLRSLSVLRRGGDRLASRRRRQRDRRLARRRLRRRAARPHGGLPDGPAARALGVFLRRLRVDDRHLRPPGLRLTGP